MIRWPGASLRPMTDAVVSNVDIASTCLAAAGLPVPEEIEGKDLLPLMTQGENPGRKVGLLRAELPRDQFAAG